MKDLNKLSKKELIAEIKALSHQQQSNEDYFRKMMKKSFDAIYLCNLEGEIIMVNKRSSDMLGYSEEELLAMKVEDLDMNYKSPDFQKKLWNQLEPEESISIFTTHRHKNGSLIPVEIRHSLIDFNESKAVLGYVKDITEHKKVEQELKDNSERFRKLIAHMPSGVAIYKAINEGADFEFLDLNKEAEKITNTTKQKVLGHTLLECFPNMKDGDFINSLKQTSEDGISIHIPPFYYKDAQRQGWRENYIYQLDSGEIVAIFNDVTDRIVAKDKLERQNQELHLSREKSKESERKFRALFEKGLIGVAYHKMIYDEAGKPIDYLFLDANDSYQKLTGVDPIGKLVTEAFPGIENDPSDWIGTFGKVATTGEEIRFQQYLEPNDRWYDCVAYLYKPDHFVTTFLEITEQKKAEQLVLESEAKFRGVFEQSPIGIELYDTDGQLIDVNQHALDMFGVKDKKEVTGFNLYEDPLLTAEDITSLKAGEPVFISTPYDFDVVTKENIYPTTRSGLMYMDMHVIPVKDKKEVTGYLVQMIDITERKQAEQALTSSEEKFSSAFNKTPLPASITDFDSGNRIAVNDRFVEVFGYSRAELLSGSFQETNLAVDTNALKNTVDLIKRDGFLHDYPFQMRTKTGEIRDLLVSAAKISTDGKHQYIISNVDITERIRLEEEMKASFERESLLADIVRDSVVGVAIGYADGSLRMCNAAFQEITGYSEEELKSIKWNDELTPPQWHEMEFRKAQEINRTKQGIKYEKEYIRKDGSIIPVELLITPRLDVHGEVEFYFAFVNDITERKNSEQLVLQNTNRLAYALKIIETGAWELDLTTMESWHSLRHDQIFGHDELLGKWTFDVFLEHVVPEDRIRVEQKFQDAIANNTDWNFDCKIKRDNDGEIRWIWANGNPELNGQDKAIKMFGIVQDITERKQAEEKLKESEEKFRTLYDNAPLSYQSLNEDGSFKDVNPTWLSILGYEREEVIGHFFKDFLHPDWQADFEDNFPKFKKRGYVSGVEFKIRHKKGHYLDIAFEGCIGYHPDGSFKQTYCVFIDITEQKKADIKLKESEANISAIVNNTADSIWSIDRDYNFIVFNKTYAAILQTLFGLEVKKGLSALRQMTPDERKLWVPLYDAVLAGEKQVFEYEYDLKGSQKYYQISLSPIYEEEAIVGVSAISTDISNIKSATQGLRESEERFDLAAKGSKDAIWDWKNIESDEYWCSDRLYEILGYQPGEVEAHISNWKKWTHPDDRDAALDVFTKHFQGEELYQVEFRMQKKDGTYVWVEVSGESIHDKDGKIIRMAGYLADISERKQAELALEKSEKHYRSLFNDSPVPLWEEDFTDVSAYLLDLKAKGEHDLRHYFESNPDELLKCSQMVKVLHVNQATLDLHQANSKKQLLENLDHTYTENSLRVYIEGLIPITEGKSTFKSEGEFRTLSGELRHIDLSLKLDRSQPGKVKALLATTDITDRKIAELAMRESEMRFKALHNASFGGIAIHDKGIIKECNQGLSDISGFAMNELVGMDGLLCIAEESRESVRKNIREAYEEAYEIIGLRKNGEKYPARLHGKMIPYQGKNMRVVEFRDITEQKLAEEALIINKEKLNAIINTSPIGISTVDMKGNFMSSNRAYEEIVGYTKEELLNLSLFDITHPEYHPKSKELFKNLFSLDARSFSMEKKYITKSGEEIMVAVHATGITNHAGEISYGTAFIEDITERKQSEEAILLSNTRYKSLFNDSPIALWEEDFTELVSHLLELKKLGHKDLHQYFSDNPDELFKCSSLIKVLDINQATLDLHQASDKSQLIGNIDKTFTKTSSKVFIDEIISIAEGNDRFKSEAEIKTLSGELRHIRLSLRVDHSQENRIKVLLATSDITDRKLAEEKILEHTNELKMLEFLSREISGTLALDELISTAVNGLMDTIKPDSIFLFIRENDHLILKKIAPAETKLRLGEVPEHKIGECLCGMAVLQNKAVYSNDINNDVRCTWTECKRVGFRSFAALPLKKGDESIGVIGIASNTPRDFEKQSVFLETLVNAISLNIKNALLHKEVSQYSEELEEKVEERTKNLATQNKELERFNDLFVDREFRIKELKDEITELRKR